MRLDHIAYACGPEGLARAVRRLEKKLGVPIKGGGRHPRSGTTNAIAPLQDGIFLEVVGVLDHPAADKAPFGRAVKLRTAQGGGWLGWVIALHELATIEARLGRTAVPGHRTRPDGRDLNWRQIGVRDMIANPLLPFFIEWTSDPADHPSVTRADLLPPTVVEPAVDGAGAGDIALVAPGGDGSAPEAPARPTELRLVELELAGDPGQLADWLGDPSVEPLEGVHVTWVGGSPGIAAAHFDTPNGPVRIS